MYGCKYVCIYITVLNGNMLGAMDISNFTRSRSEGKRKDVREKKKHKNDRSQFCCFLIIVILLSSRITASILINNITGIISASTISLRMLAKQEFPASLWIYHPGKENRHTHTHNITENVMPRRYGCKL